ncbi:nucleoside deaminase [Streptomyces longisporoflavus]|uniref:Nucleoside deaminase n=1 Tax=Streptomyces longisporoflavus TaxID=28044 RepID=A0ABW7QSG4_9ACTN
MTPHESDLPAPDATSAAEVGEADLPYLRRCVELAAEALAAGDLPFGSVLVDADGGIRAEDRNREITTNDPTAHPEFALARWAAAHLKPDERAAATVYTSGEHCPMCAAAHGWVGLGRIVYASSSRQAREWKAEWGVPLTSPLSPLTVRDIVPGLEVAGPVPELAAQVRGLQWRRLRAKQGAGE